MKEITLIWCIFIASVLLNSCEDYLQDDMITTTITDEQIDQNIKKHFNSFGKCSIHQQ